MVWLKLMPLVAGATPTRCALLGSPPCGEAHCWRKVGLIRQGLAFGLFGPDETSSPSTNSRLKLEAACSSEIS